MKLKANPNSREAAREKSYEGLAKSYLIDPRPIQYWVVSVKKPWRGSWSSCTVHIRRDDALGDLRRCREHFRRWAPWGSAYLITAHLN